MKWRIDVWDRNGAHKSGWPKDMTSADMTGARFRVKPNGVDGVLIPIEATILGHPQTLGITWGEFVQFSVSELGDWSDTVHLFYGDVRRCPSAASTEEGKWRVVGLHSKRLGYVDLEGTILYQGGHGDFTTVAEGQSYDLGLLANAGLGNALRVNPAYLFNRLKIHLTSCQIVYLAHNNQDVKSFLDKLCQMYNQPSGAPVGQLNQCVWYIGADRYAYFGVPDGGTIPLDEEDLLPVSGESIWEDVDAEEMVTAVRWMMPYSDTLPKNESYNFPSTPFRQKEILTELIYPDATLPYSVIRTAILLNEMVAFEEVGDAEGAEAGFEMPYGGHLLGVRIRLTGSPAPETAEVLINQIFTVPGGVVGYARTFEVKSGDIIWWRTDYQSDDDPPETRVAVSNGAGVGVDARMERVWFDADKLERIARLFFKVPGLNAARWKTLGLHTSMAHEVVISTVGGESVTIPLDSLEYVVEPEDYMTTEWQAGQRADPETLAYWALVQEQAQRQLNGTLDVTVGG